MPTTEPFTAFDPLTSACLVAVLGVAVVTDLRSQRIPNRLVVAGTLAALALQAFHHGAGDGTWRWLCGFAAGFAPFLLLYLVRAVGAGDVKLMGCVGACTGSAAMPEILLATLLAGGVLGLAVMVLRGQTRRTLHALVGMVLWLPFATHTATQAASPADASAGTGAMHGATPSGASGAGGTDGAGRRIRTVARLPYAVAIATGVALVMAGVL